MLASITFAYTGIFHKYLETLNYKGYKEKSKENIDYYDYYILYSCWRHHNDSLGLCGGGTPSYHYYHQHITTATSTTQQTNSI